MPTATPALGGITGLVTPVSMPFTGCVKITLDAEVADETIDLSSTESMNSPPKRLMNASPWLGEASYLRHG